MSDQPTAPHAKFDSYRAILHSTALIGGSSVIVMFFALVRMKVLAVLLGPAGVGLLALYSAVADIVVAVAGLGVSQSGVRQIAQAEGSGDRNRIAATVDTVERASLMLGLGGGLGLAILSIPAALLTFGSAEYALAVAALGIVVWLRVLTGGQTALLQGVRRVRDLATVNVIAAIAGTVLTVPMVFVWREAAIVPALIFGALATWIAARRYCRQVPGVRGIPFTKVPSSELGELLRLGFAFMISGLLTMGAAYAVRILVLHDEGVEAAGLYQAAWAISGLYVTVVLQSMGTDFYPRLAGVIQDSAAVTRLVNEQTQVSLLLAGPGVIATITFSHLVVIAFYSVEFTAAAGLLRWLCIGMMLRVVSWPMGYIIVAKGWQKTFIGIEIAATILHVGLAALLIPVIGLEGSGIAFAVLYICHGPLVYYIARRSIAFSFSAGNLKLLVLYGSACAMVFGGFVWLPLWWAIAGGTLVSIGVGFYSLFELRRMLPNLLAGMKLPRWFSRRAV